MYARRLTRLLLIPSLLSGTAVICLALSVLGYNAWLYISENQLFYEYLFGANGLKTYLWQNSLDTTAWKNTLLGSPAAYYVLVGAVAVAAGLVVFTALQWLSLLFRGGSSLWREMHAAPTPQHKAIMMDSLSRLGLRIVSLIGWGLYAAFFFSTMLPFVIVLNQLGVSHITMIESVGWLACTGAALLFALTLHLHVVFLRLVFLRPRLFGGDRAIEEAEATANEHILAD